MDKKIAIKKIVAIGPESTGKSRLCEMLASHFHTTWVPEYAREYLVTNGTDYTLDQLSDIAEGQIKAEEQIIHQFCKTNPQITEKAFPVFIKNISGRKLLLSDLKNLPLAFLNEKNKWQMIWNENSMGECMVGGWENHYYWELLPDEIMVLSVNFLKGKQKQVGLAND